MGEVWRAVHRSSTPVALKIISANAERGLDPVGALQAEIRAVAALQHPNIVPVFDAGVLGPEHEGMSGGKLVAGSPWLAMELAQGSAHDLQEEMDWGLLVSMLVQVLDGLAHAHARGVIHRDLKPANVLFTRIDGRVRVLLADFGLAWAWRRTSEPLDGGTAAYSAPEQLIRQLSEQGPWTDLYSLGCTAFRLVAGRRPFRGQTADELQRAHLFSPIPKLTPRFPVPQGFATWLEGMMAKDPRERFQRAADAAWSLMQLPAPASENIDEEDDADTVSVLHSDRERTRTLPVEAWRSVAPRRSEPALAAAQTRAPVPRDWVRPHHDQPRVGARGLGLFGLFDCPLVARNDERDQLWRALVGGTQLALAVVTGPEGIGKSRLGAWLCERAHEIGAAEVFRASFSRDNAGVPRGLPALVEEPLRTHGLDGQDLLSHLQTMVKNDHQYADIDPAALARLLRPQDDALPVKSLPLDDRVALTYRLIRRRLDQRRLLIWLDDVGDSTSALALVRYLSRHAAKVPGLVLISLRSPMPKVTRNKLNPLYSQLEGLHLELPPLSQPEAQDLVRGLLPVPSELASRIAEASKGHPRSAMNIVNGLVQRGQLRGDATGVVIDPSVPLPDSLGSLYEGALQQVKTLGPSGRTALELAAVLGSNVAVPEWRNACRLLGVELNPQLLALIVTRGFIAPTRGGRYRFGQGVLRDALIDAAGREGRAAMLHEICGQVLASGGNSLAARAGEHFESANRPDLAAEAYLKAMRWLSGWDREKALEHGTRWYACLGRVAGEGDPRWASGMQVLVELLGVQGGDAHQRATAELLERGRGDPTAETRALIELSYADLRAQELDRASARAELAWHKSAGTELRGDAAVARAEVRRHRGEFAQAEQILREVLEDDSDAAVVTLALARVLCDDGRGREALTILDGWADRSTVTSAPMTRARLQRARGRALFVLGHREQAVQVFEEACELRDRAGFDWPMLDLDLATAVAETQPKRAMRLLEHALGRLDATHDARSRSDALAMLAWMHATAADWEAVEDCIDGLEDLPQRGRKPETLSRLLELADLAQASGELLLARRAKRWVRGEAHTTPLPH